MFAMNKIFRNVAVFSCFHLYLRQDYYDPGFPVPVDVQKGTGSPYNASRTFWWKNSSCVLSWSTFFQR